MSRRSILVASWLPSGLIHLVKFTAIVVKAILSYFHKNALHCIKEVLKLTKVKHPPLSRSRAYFK